MFDEFIESSKNEMDEILRFIRDSGIKSIVIDSMREKAIEENRKKLNEFEEHLSSLWTFSIPFSKNEISNIFKRKRQIENYLNEIRNLLTDLNKAEIDEVSIKCERYLKAAQLEFERLCDSLDKAIDELIIPKLKFPVFFYSMGDVDQLADLILFCLSNANRSLQILSPYIDNPFTRILGLIAEKKKINLEILIGEEPSESTKETLSLLTSSFSNLNVKINHDLHGRCIIVDEKYVFVHNTDFQTTRRLGRIDSGLGVEDLVDNAKFFFKETWKHSVDFQDRKLPMESLSNAIVIAKARSILPVKTEIKMLLFNSDPSVTYRELLGKGKDVRLGFIDSELNPNRIYLDLNQPSRKHIQRIFLYNGVYVIPGEVSSLEEYLLEENPEEIAVFNKRDYENEIAKLEVATGVRIKDEPTELTQIIIFFVRNKALLYKEKKFTK